MTASPAPSPARLSRQVREQFVAEIIQWLPQLTATMRERLSTAIDSAPSIQEQRLAIDARMAFEPRCDAWMQRVRQGLDKALTRPAPAAGGGDMSGVTAFALVDDEVVENKIIASRLSLAVIDKSGSELSDLNVRVQSLDRVADMPPKDVLRPESVAAVLIEQWRACELTREMWAVVHETVRAALALAMAQAYHNANQWLIQQGVMPQINLKSMVRRTGGGPGGSGASAAAPGEQGGDGGNSYPAPPDVGQQGGAYDGGAYEGGYGGPGGMAGGYGGAGAAGGYGQADQAAMPAQVLPGVRSTDLMRVAEETRMLTGAAPMLRMRARAHGVLGRLRRFLSDKVTNFSHTQPVTPSPRLAQALARPQPEEAPGTTVSMLLDAEADADVAHGSTLLMAPEEQVGQVAGQLLQQAAHLKQEAEGKSEKAIIEIVALIFQAILAEERIPAAIRIWFARLQIPVLRLALAEPDFFSNIDHPARQLIDRMGACAMGFEAASVSSARLEQEIKRIVQVIEQYPETGRRVFQLVLDEFKKFLNQFLTEGGSAERVATLAQQVEQKEALTVQYTIELNKMLTNLPVNDEIRFFLFHVWAEALATVTVRDGGQSEHTHQLKRAAHDLLWAVSAKPDREDRARVLQTLPALLQTLRYGMSALGLSAEEQDGHIKTLRDAVSQAFMARSESINEQALAELSRKLDALEDIVSEGDAGDLMLDPGAIELMLGVDAGDLFVITSGGSMPGPAALAWARELELGAWFQMEEQAHPGGGATRPGHLLRVQYVWRSQRGLLHIFTGGNKNYMVQTRRLAAWLQAGLITQEEDEALTVRATRDALARLDARPDQLLS